MNDRKLDRLFLRYRQKGDAAALGEVFDRAAPELLALAMHLVRSPVEAEDVLQATFLAAIEGADSFDASRRLMPWLTGILARQAGLVRRSARRVIEPDRLHERAQEDPEESAALREFSAELVGALQGLPENYREVLWLHLADGKRPIDIAQELERAPGTVRMQVHRGLELLRRALPAGFAAAALGTFGATRGLAAVRAQVLGAAARASLAAPLASSAAWSTAALVKGSLALLGVLLLAGAVAWRALHGTSGSEERVSVAPHSAPEIAAAAGGALAAQPSSRTALATDPALPAQRATNAAQILRGHVSGVPAGEQADVAISVTAFARSPLPAELTLRATPAADGSFEIDLARLFAAAKPRRPLEELVVVADHPRCVREEARVAIDAPRGADGAYAVELELAPAARVAGRVLPRPAHSGEDATVLLFALAGGKPLAPPQDRATCAADGAFTLRARDAGPHVLVALREAARPASVALALVPGSAMELGTILLDEGATLEGVAFHMGAPMRAGALVNAATTAGGTWYAFEGSRYLWSGAAFERGGGIVETEGDGSFAIGGLAPGPYRLGVSRAAPAGAPESQKRLLLSTAQWTSADAPARDVRIDASFATVHLEVRADAAASTGRRALVRIEQGANHAEFPVELGGTGSVSVEPGVACKVRVAAEGFVAEELAFAPPAAGAEGTQLVVLRKDPALAELAIQVDVPQGDAPLAEAAFQFTSDDAELAAAPAFTRAATGEGGAFVLTDLPAGAWSVSVYAGDAYRHHRDGWCAALAHVRLAAGERRSCAVALVRGGKLSLAAFGAGGSRIGADCSVRDRDGALLDVEFVARAPERVAKSRRALGTLADSEVHPNLPPGEYEVSLSAPGFEPQRVAVHVEPRGAQRVRALLLAAEPVR